MQRLQFDSTAQIFLVSNLIVIGLVALIVTFVVVYQRRLLRQQKRMREQEAAHQKQLLSASIQTQEIERQRIAKDLHDEIGAMLSVVKMKVNQAKRKADGDQEVNPVLVETTDLLTESIQSVRRISHALLPPMLDKFGLEMALKSMVDKAQSSEGPKLIFQKEGIYHRIPKDKELGLYRVIQEIFNNALKHAQARHIIISLNAYPDHLKIGIEDDGVGFDVKKKMAESTGLGLKNIESRILTLGGKFDFFSEPGKGTRVEIVLEFAPEIEKT